MVGRMSAAHARECARIYVIQFVQNLLTEKLKELRANPHTIPASALNNPIALLRYCVLNSRIAQFKIDNTLLIRCFQPANPFELEALETLFANKQNITLGELATQCQDAELVNKIFTFFEAGDSVLAVILRNRDFQQFLNRELQDNTRTLTQQAAAQARNNTSQSSSSQTAVIEVKVRAPLDDDPNAEHYQNIFNPTLPSMRSTADTLYDLIKMTQDFIRTFNFYENVRLLNAKGIPGLVTKFLLELQKLEKALYLRTNEEDLKQELIQLLMKTYHQMHQASQFHYYRWQIYLILSACKLIDPSSELCKNAADGYDDSTPKRRHKIWQFDYYEWTTYQAPGDFIYNIFQGDPLTFDDATAINDNIYKPFQELINAYRTKDEPKKKSNDQRQIL
jgi:hypothetical protein